MPAMVMPYKVQDPALLEGKKPGDMVTATLVVEEVNCYLTTLTTTGHEPIKTPAAGPLITDADILKDGDLVPDHALVDQTGTPLPMQSLRGHRVALTFMYTRCPLPDFCPLMDKHFASVQDADQEVARPGRRPARLRHPRPAVRHACRSGPARQGARRGSRALAFRDGQCGRRARVRETLRRHRRTRGDGRRARAQPEDRGHRFPGSPRQGLLRQHVVAGGTRCRSQSDSPSRALTGRARRLSRCTPNERRLIARLRTPAAVQRWLNALPYNTERGGETLRGFRGVVRTGTAHCLEAALSAAVILEQHRYPPLVLSFESIDLLDHVIFVYRGPHGWGSVARSRDPGLHGRKPVFATPRALALSYFEGYIDFTGRIKAYAVVDLRVLGSYDWRLGDGQSVEGRAAAARVAASAHRLLRSPREAPAPPLRSLQAGARVQAVEVLRRAGALDAAAGRVQEQGLSVREGASVRQCEVRGAGRDVGLASAPSHPARRTSELSPGRSPSWVS